MPVAIERPDGRLLDLLLEAGHPVVPVEPNAIKTWKLVQEGRSPLRAGRERATLVAARGGGRR